MKNLLLIFVILAVVSCQSGTKKESASGPDAVEVTEVTIDIGGMHCNNCVASVEKGINALEGIASVTVSLSDSNAIVAYNAQKLNQDDIEKAIEKRGYRIKNN